MKTLRQALVVGLMVAMTGSFAAAQTFTGGLRGAVRDANGVIPGVTVELINEATGAPREAVSNESGEYSFAAVPPGTYTVRATLTGFKTYENKGVRIAHAAVRHARHHPRSRPAAGDDHRHRRRAAHRHVEGVDRRGDRRAAAVDAAERRPVGVPVRRHRAHRGRLGRLPVQPPAGPDQRLAAVARRRHPPRQQLPDRRRADHRHAQPRLGQPDASRRCRTSPCRCTPTTPRPAAPAAAPSTPPPSRAPTSGTAAASTRTGRSGARRRTTSPRPAPLPDTYFHLGGGGFGGPIIRNRTFFWARGRRLRLEHDPQRQPAAADRP